MNRRSSLLLFLLGALGLGNASLAQADIVERVVATVNDEALFLSDLRRRAAPVLPRLLSISDPEARQERINEVYSELLEQLINEELFEQAARRMQVRVSSRDVQRAVERVMQDNNLTEDQFWQAVEAQGYTAAGYRSDVRRQLLRLKVLNQRVRGRVNITEDDVRQRYEQRLRQANRSLRFQVAHVFVAVEPGANATEVASRRREALALRGELSPENFLETAGEVGGGELGWIGENDLPEDLVTPLQTMEPGQISRPVRGTRGFHIFWLQDRERGGADLPSFDEVKNALYQQMMATAMERQERVFLQELRRSAIIERREP